ncbi:restriction endonuclease subunit S [Geminocystis sp. NIES-3709]|uniref:restriction endonuclease subunit S n=1 Tax=Geminocystis sp. NIES-3709 TaxID=1617448 RepID=UPI0005FC5FA0|nr:restriction endonuclease subunit S [Geminocystis sp. NIES-3709]BAQ66967.1 type I restriction-modification system [Geminocystis sp. NIES-3709]
MMLSLPKYDCYKDSGVDWLGEIPAHWQVKRLGFEANTIVPMRDKPVDLSGDIPWIRIEDFDGKYISSSKSGQGVSINTVKKMNLKIYPKNTVLCSCSCSMGTTAIAKNPLISNQTFIGIYPFKSFISDYLYYLLNASRNYLTQLSTGAIQQYLSKDDFRNLRLPTPPIEEQERIVKFLDRKCEEVKKSIELKQRLIALLDEQKSIVINQAVTKGLNPHAPMKDSGIDWLGDIPAHWEVKKLKYMGTAIIGLTYAPKDLTDENNGTLVLRSSNIQNGKICFKSNVFVKSKIPKHLITKRHDILICSRNGSRELIGKNALIEEKSIGLSFGAFTTVFRSDFNPFLYYIFNSNIFKSQSGLFLTSTINQLTTGTLNNFKIPIPPIEEQEKIVEYLEQKTAEIEELKEKTLQQIEKLKEFKQILIAEAVTGKIKV